MNFINVFTIKQQIKFLANLRQTFNIPLFVFWNRHHSKINKKRNFQDIFPKKTYLIHFESATCWIIIFGAIFARINPSSSAFFSSCTYSPPFPARPTYRRSVRRRPLLSPASPPLRVYSSAHARAETWKNLLGSELRRVLVRSLAAVTSRSFRSA